MIEISKKNNEERVLGGIDTPKTYLRQERQRKAVSNLHN